ncbi:MAG: PTS sugar transporter subunit IIC [Peptostreptococcaceae bacterium]|jgi:uncharacterized membrane protein|nr:PTS sugar transporter subunit IIC [Peptostreptococcaceae bacterium]
MRSYLTKTLNGMGLGLFCSLIIGLILKQLGDLIGLKELIIFGKTAQVMMGPAIGASVAFSLGSPPLVLFASLVSGALGANSLALLENGIQISIGEPVGAFVASLIACEVGRKINGKTKVDIVLVPAITIIIGGLVATLVSPFVSSIMKNIGSMINMATTLQPVPMGIILSVFMGILLTLPISSAALSIALGLNGIAAGASLIGCCCQMVGFAISSYKENKVEGLIALGLGTSMLQVPNIIKNPKIWIPPIVASAILGPISTTLLKLETNSIGAGMGTSGLVGQFATVSVMGKDILPTIIVMHFILPAIISYMVSKYLRHKNWIKDNDMLLKNTK